MESEEITKRLSNKELFSHVLKQVSKDFYGFLDYESEEKLDATTPQELVEDVQAAIGEISGDSFTQFLQLFYRIDVKENKVQLILGNSQFSEKERHYELAMLALNRIAEKVWNRLEYSRKLNLP